MPKETKTKKCPKCKGKMVKGTADAGFIFYYPLLWAANGGLDWMVKRKIISAYACEKCRYMESYLEP